MLFDQVTPAESEAARVFTGVTMAAFIAAPLLRRHARAFRLAVAGFYLIGFVGFIIYYVVKPS